MAKAEGRIEGFAEDLGRLLGTAEAKAKGWLGQRQSIAKQLTQIRDTASELLQQMTGGGARVAAAVRRGRVALGRPKGSVKKKRTMSAKARKAISLAQKKRWAERKAGAREK
jgi:hypothetical protein